MNIYDILHKATLSDPQTFWSAAAADLHWDRPWTTLCDDSKAPLYRWFAGGSINICYNCVDRHVIMGEGDRVALIYDSPVTDSVSKITYRQLQEQVSLVAGALVQQGVSKGDRVLIYMPMIPEVVVTMLACARIGAVHSVVFGGFAAKELAARVDDATPSLVVSASCGIEGKRVVPYKPILDEALAMAIHKPAHTIILQRPQAPADLNAPRDLDWAAVMARAHTVDCVPVDANDPLYILYTSGTTGAPKGILRDTAGYAVALNWSMQYLYGVQPGEVFWAASDVGWVVGHSYIVYGPLLHGCTSVVYEGKPVGTPDPGAFWRVIDQHKVSVLFTAPTAIRAIRKEDPTAEHMTRYDIDGLRALFLAGERCDPDTLIWAEAQLGRPVVDHWWQTETGWPIAGNPLGIQRLPIKPGSTALPMPGYDVQILDENSQPVPAGEQGDICIKLPMAPGNLASIWGADERFIQTYLTRHKGYYQTGDAGYIDSDGYLFVMGRTDDVINTAGHRLSTGAMEEVLATHTAIAECAVVGAADKLKGQIPVGFVVLKAGMEVDPAQVEKDCVAMVRAQIGPVAAFKQVHVVRGLPKTRSGKILRKTIRQICDGETPSVPATIEDPAVLDIIRESLAAPTAA